MTQLRLLVALAVAWLLAASMPLHADVAVPPLKTRVTDLTATLSADQRASLESRLAAFETRKGSQIAVLMVPTTQPETIEQYAIRVAEQWKIGRSKIDDGAILVVAINDRALRIEVGYGLEGALSDLVAKRIISEIIVPRFRSGDFVGGVDAGVTRMMSVIDGEPLPAPKAQGQSGGGLPLQEILGLGFVLIFVVGGIVRSIFGRTLGSGVLGAVGAGAAWLILGSAAAAGVVGILVGVLSLFGGLANIGGRGRGGWSSGGWSSGGSWGGGSSGGWGGGGGGGFGGGGASGRW